MSEKISVETASKILGISPNEIRYCLRNGTLPIGYARRANSARLSYRYDVFKNKVMKYAGLTKWPLEE